MYYQPTNRNRYHTGKLDIFEIETIFATRASVQNVLYLGGVSGQMQPSLHNSLLEQVWGHHNIYLDIGIAQTALSQHNIQGYLYNFQKHDMDVCFISRYATDNS